MFTERYRERVVGQLGFEPPESTLAEGTGKRVSLSQKAAEEKVGSWIWCGRFTLKTSNGSTHGVWDWIASEKGQTWSDIGLGFGGENMQVLLAAGFEGWLSG